MNIHVFVGLPASGKSTFCEHTFPEFAVLQSVNLQQFNKVQAQIVGSKGVIISKDKIGNSKKEAKQNLLITTALAAGKDVAIDNCNVQKAERGTILAHAKRFGARTTCYYFHCNIDVCFARNSLRDGKAKVPRPAIYLKRKLLEVPTADEGFDHFYVVRTQADRIFELERVYV